MNSTSAIHIETLLPSRRSLVSGAITLAMGGLLLLFSASLTHEPSLPPLTKFTAAALTLLVAAVALQGGVRMLRGSGGLFYDPRSGAVGVGLTGPQDIWWIGADALIGICISPSEPGAGEDADPWHAALCLPNGVEVVLADAPGRLVADELAQTLAGRLGLALLDAPPTPPPPGTTDTLRFGVREGAALNTALPLLGAAFFGVGVMLYVRVAVAPIFGFLFGPFLGLLGLTLLSISVIKRFATEEIQVDGTCWTHRFRLGRRAWGEGTCRTSSPRWRIRAKASRGAHLELVGEERILILGNGATTQSHQGVDALASLPSRLAEGPRAPHPTPTRN